MGVLNRRRVSVIVPTRDRPAMLRGALASIRAIEGPDIAFEIVVADNGRSPETAAIADEYRALRVPVSGEGASIARNAALAIASGDYLAFLDDDDEWISTHLRRHIELLETRPDIDGVIGQVVSADHQMRRVGEPWPNEPMGEGDELLRRMLSGYFPQIGAVVCRANVRDAIGHFDEKLIGGEDLDWLLRLARQDKLTVVHTESVLFRGRPLGSYDALQLKRSHYDRKVFLRHALAEWRIWKSPGQFFNAYYGTLRHYYRYFVDLALRHAARGERWQALRAIWFAFRVFPLRTTYHLLSKRRLRMAWIGAFSPRPNRSAAMMHLFVTFAMAAPV